MSTQTKALKLALEALKKSDGFLYNWHENYSDDEADAYAAARQLNEQAIIAAEKALMSVSDGAQPAQEQNLKLMPREATPEMLKAMDECSTEGYDERLYEGHAGSVYMAAWDAFYGQHCYCGDITNLGVIHRDDGPCHYPDHKEPEQEPVAWITQGGKGWLRWHKSYDDNKDSVPLYTTPPQRKPSKEDALYETFAKIAAYLEIDTEAARSAAGKPSDVFIEAIKKREAPQRKPLTDEMVLAGARALAKRHADSCGLDFDDVWKYYADEHKDDAKVVIEAAHGIKE